MTILFIKRVNLSGQLLLTYITNASRITRLNSIISGINTILGIRQMPEFSLRWYISRRVEVYKGSWISSIPPRYNNIDSKPVLQYSTDGIFWKNVETVIEEVIR